MVDQLLPPVLTGDGTREVGLGDFEELRPGTGDEHVERHGDEVDVDALTALFVEVELGRHAPDVLPLVVALRLARTVREPHRHRDALASEVLGDAVPTGDVGGDEVPDHAEPVRVCPAGPWLVVDHVLAERRQQFACRDLVCVASRHALHLHLCGANSSHRADDELTGSSSGLSQSGRARCGRTDGHDDVRLHRHRQFDPAVERPVVDGPGAQDARRDPPRRSRRRGRIHLLHDRRRLRSRVRACRCRDPGGGVGTTPPRTTPSGRTAPTSRFGSECTSAGPRSATATTSGHR